MKRVSCRSIIAEWGYGLPWQWRICPRWREADPQKLDLLSLNVDAPKSNHHVDGAHSSQAHGASICLWPQQQQNKIQ